MKQLVEMSFFHSVSKLSHKGIIQSWDIWKRFEVELLLLQIKMHLLRWLWHLVRMPPWWGVSGMSIWKVTPGVDLRQILYLSWPGKPQYPSSGAGVPWSKTGATDLRCSHISDPDKQWKTDGWMGNKWEGINHGRSREDTLRQNDWRKRNRLFLRVKS